MSEKKEGMEIPQYLFVVPVTPRVCHILVGLLGTV